MGARARSGTLSLPNALKASVPRSSGNRTPSSTVRRVPRRKDVRQPNLQALPVTTPALEQCGDAYCTCRHGLSPAESFAGSPGRIGVSNSPRSNHLLEAFSPSALLSAHFFSTPDDHALFPRTPRTRGAACPGSRSWARGPGLGVRGSRSAARGPGLGVRGSGSGARGPGAPRVRQTRARW